MYNGSARGGWNLCGASWHPSESRLRAKEQNELFLIVVNAQGKTCMKENPRKIKLAVKT